LLLAWGQELAAVDWARTKVYSTLLYSTTNKMLWCFTTLSLLCKCNQISCIHCHSNLHSCHVVANQQIV